MRLRQNRLPTIVAMVVGLTVSGCAGSIHERDLPGTYRAAYDFGTEELTLRADSTYEQTLAEAGRPPVSINRGRWTIAHGDAWDRTVLVLHDAVGLVDGFGKRSDPARQTTLWRLPTRRAGNEIRLVINEDIGLAFVKVTTANH
jgi:hypothetical protein